MPKIEEPTSLRTEVLELLRRWHPETVADLAMMLEKKRGIRTTPRSLADLLKQLTRDGTLELMPVRVHHARIAPFLADLQLTGDFWAMIACVVILSGIVLFPSVMLLMPLRWGLGIIAIVLFPGYSMQMCLFPGEDELQLWKRILLGIGLSIAITGFYAVILDATTPGIILSSALIVFTFHTLVFASIGLLRRYEAQQVRP